LISYSVVAAGGGVALVDSLAAASGAFPILAAREFVPRIESHVILVYPRDRPRSRLAVAFARKLTGSTSRPLAGEQPCCSLRFVIPPSRPASQHAAVLGAATSRFAGEVYGDKGRLYRTPILRFAAPDSGVHLGASAF
jgi:hypothetical protein